MATFRISLLFFLSIHTLTSFYVSTTNTASKLSILKYVRILKQSAPDDVPRTGAGGEWTDWDNDSNMEDEDNEIPTISKGLLKAGTSEVVSKLFGSINNNINALSSNSANKTGGEEEIPKSSGEWSDWDNDSYMEDEYTYDPDASFPSMALLQAGSGQAVSNLLGNLNENIDKLSADKEKTEEPKGVYVRNENDWVGWNEDPPYFDDDDIIEKKTIDYGGEKGVKSSTTDLFAKPNIVGNAPVPTPSVAYSTPVESSSGSDKASSSIPAGAGALASSSSFGDSTTNFLLLLEINRRFDNLEKKIGSMSVNNKSPVENILLPILGFLFFSELLFAFGK
jgi:hypothetical protein